MVQKGYILASGNRIAQALRESVRSGEISWAPASQLGSVFGATPDALAAQFGISYCCLRATHDSDSAELKTWAAGRTLLEVITSESDLRYFFCGDEVGHLHTDVEAVVEIPGHADASRAQSLEGALSAPVNAG
jgi:hypothetical protein